MIELKGISKIYQQNTSPSVALEEVSLTIGQGELVAVMGPSGSGKSTLLNIIGCMDTPTSGTYLLDGVDVTASSRNRQQKLRKEKISFVFQHFALMDMYTAYENVEVPLTARNVKRGKRKKIIEQCLEEMGIGDLKKRYPNQMSGGQKQRTAIARALAAGTPIVLCDEPTGALDQKTGQEVINVLKQINQNGVTVIIVTHDPRIAAQTDRILYILDGKIVEDRKK
ncbi:MAG TPA: ABC transporter ATP-binding protein [Candidatus Fimimorpha excrementavium]|nr:ABC transporter ATP-binding protein [Candidatus Fimimorpha excrementavium]